MVQITLEIFSSKYP